MIQRTQQGFVILFSVLIAASILLIGFGMYSASYKSTVLSSVARESHVAFYAASTGVECALLGIMQNQQMPWNDISCVFNNISPVATSGNIVSFAFPMPSNGCGNVGITDTGSTTVIRSRGYNICTANYAPDINDPLLVERVLEVTLVNNTGSGSQQVLGQSVLNTSIAPPGPRGTPIKTYTGSSISNQNYLNTYSATGGFSGPNSSTSTMQPATRF